MMDVLMDALEEVRVMLQRHNGGIELVSWDDSTGELVLRFTGACANCALSSMTLKRGVEVLLCEKVPAIQKIHCSSS
ncbi:MAG: NifU family protein [Patescibacteria group bacterium]|jgi:Fe-S cluster biogenesis protein NfuA